MRRESKAVTGNRWWDVFPLFPAPAFRQIALFSHFLCLPASFPVSNPLSTARMHTHKWPWCLEGPDSVFVTEVGLDLPVVLPGRLVVPRVDMPIKSHQMQSHPTMAFPCGPSFLTRKWSVACSCVAGRGTCTIWMAGWLLDLRGLVMLVIPCALNAKAVNYEGDGPVWWLTGKGLITWVSSKVGFYSHVHTFAHMHNEQINKCEKLKI